MCGRYTGYVDDADEIKSIYTAAKRAYPQTNFSSGEIYPTNTVPLIGGIKASIFPAVWGFRSHAGSSVIINARAETAAEKPMFRSCLMNSRCIVPTTGYIEWSAEKEKFRFGLPGKRMLYLAGICGGEGENVRFAILTTSANSSAVKYHNRMPVILPEHLFDMWLSDTRRSVEYLKSEMPAVTAQCC